MAYLAHTSLVRKYAPVSVAAHIANRAQLGSCVRISPHFRLLTCYLVHIYSECRYEQCCGSCVEPRTNLVHPFSAVLSTPESACPVGLGSLDSCDAWSPTAVTRPMMTMPDASVLTRLPDGIYAAFL